MFGQKAEILRYRSEQHFTVERQRVRKKSHHSVFRILALLLIVDNGVGSPNPHPVPNVLTGHQ